MKVFPSMLLLCMSLQGVSQKTNFELSSGIRTETVDIKVISGSVEVVPTANIFLEAGLIRHFKNKLRARGGVIVQTYQSLTTIEKGLDFNAQLTRQLFPVTYLGLERNLTKSSRFESNFGINQQFLFISSDENLVEKSGSESGFSKVETVRNFRTVNPITQFSFQFNLKSPKDKKYVFMNLGYNLGWFNLLEREIEYNFDSKSGRAVSTTKGSGLQVKFGVGF